MNKDLPKRKSTRLPIFDYAMPGKYFITVCVHQRRNILSKIVGEGSPLPLLSSYGKAVEKLIKRISEQYPGICVEAYVIMPNHIHLLLSLTGIDGRGDPSPTITQVVGWLKYQATKEINALRGSSGEKVFQRSFHDHVIRNQNDYEEIYSYIHDNPRRWKQDTFFSGE